jgi:diguanylate cyclase (GGDEF)-like protein
MGHEDQLRTDELTEHSVGTIDTFAASKYMEILTLQNKILNLIATENNESEIVYRLQKLEEKLSHMAFHDSLTGLANKTKLFDRIDQFIKRSRRSQTMGALLYLQLDQLNETYGEALGNQMLIDVAERLNSRVRSHDLLARIGENEFVLWLEDMQNVGEAQIVAEKFLSVFYEPFVIRSKEHLLQGNIGIALYPQDSRERDSLMSNAYEAMLRSKEDPKRRIAFHRVQMTQQAKTSLKLETELYQALKHREFELYYQPKIDALTGKLRGAEALIRWNHPTRGMVMPNDFIPYAEQTSLISELGEYVLERALEQLRIWRKNSSVEISISVNLSGRQLNDDDINSILRILGIHIDLAPLIVIELTETFLMHHAHSAVGMLERLKKSGVKLSIDDFGTGYSSLGYLKRFRVDELKIDRLLINDIVTDPNDRVISSAVIAMAHTLGLSVVAEGVENAEQIAILRESGCDLFQGFYFDKPLDVETFYERYLQGE